jgi:hypothetical protein
MVTTQGDIITDAAQTWRASEFAADFRGIYCCGASYHANAPAKERSRTISFAVT